MKKKCAKKSDKAPEKKCPNCSCDKQDKSSTNSLRLGALGNVNVLGTKENSDGSLDIEFECDDKFIEFYKSETGAKRVTKAGLSKFISEIIESKIKKEE